MSSLTRANQHFSGKVRGRAICKAWSSPDSVLRLCVSHMTASEEAGSLALTISIGAGAE